MDREIKKLVDNFAQRNMKKVHKICINDLSVFTLRNYSEGYKINKPLSSLLVYVLNISQLPSKLGFLANCSFFVQSFSLGHYPLIYQLQKGVYLLNKNPLNLQIYQIELQ